MSEDPSAPASWCHVPGGLTSLAALAAESADEIERHQRLPAPLVGQMRDAGLFQLYVRHSLGGPGADPLVAYDAVETLSRADASTGWCVMVGTTSAYLLGWMPDDVARDLFGDPVDVRLAGSTRPLGTASPVPGGYRVRGRWDFTSGIRHATGVIAAATVDAGPEAGTARMCFLRPADVEVLDTWDVIGMRGTGSHDVVADEVFVPEEHTVVPSGDPVAPSLLHHPRLLRVAAHVPVAGVVLGIVQGALDDLAALADRRTTLNAVPLRERADVHTAVAEATALVESARAYVRQTAAEAWQMAARETEGGADPADLGRAVARCRLAVAYSGEASRRALDCVFASAGTPAAHRHNRLERRLRDLSVARFFPAFDAAVTRQAGHVLLGGTAEGSGW